jgi:signal peptidase II
MTSAAKGKGALWVITLILFVDQFSKCWVKTHMALHESITVTPWFQIYFTENPGMAFGMEVVDKLFLTLFRIVAMLAIGWFLYKLVSRNASFGLIACFAMILAGAMGNIVDSIFYGVIFNSSVGQVAQFFPPNGGYGEWLHGKVVDMLYFPLIQTRLPDWLPFWGGHSFIFFRPIFNLADSAICVSVFLLLLFHRKSLSTLTLSGKKKGNAR